MNCLQCGKEMKLEISNIISEGKLKNGRNPMTGDYYCYACDVVFHVIMSHIYHVKNSLILKDGKWKTGDKWKLESFQSE